MPDPKATANPASPLAPQGARGRAAILVIDIVESTRLASELGEVLIARWQRLAGDIVTCVREAHGGTLRRAMGDGLLFTFDAPRLAVAAALAIQRLAAHHAEGSRAEDAIWLRIGLHVDTVIVDDTDIHGFGLALATRLLTVAAPGDIVCSSELRDELTDGLSADFEDLGPCHLKHVPEPVRAYRVSEPQAGWALRKSVLAPPDPAALRLSVAVLPFETTSDDPAAGVVGELFADQLIAALSRGAHLRVVSRLSSRALLGMGLPMRDIASRLHVAYVVSGRLVVRGNELFAMAEVASAESDQVIWARTLRTDVRQLLSVDDGLAAQVASEVCETILESQLRRVRSAPLPSLEGYSLLLGGIALMHRFSPRDFARAKECLDSLIERAPRHAEPHAWAARWHVFRAVQGWTTDAERDRAQAEDLCRRALDLDPDSVLALTIAGSVETSLTRDIDRAQTLYRDAIRVDPSEPLAWVLLGTSHSFKGEGDEALRCCTRAVQLTPLDPMRFYYDNHLAAAAVAAGDYETGIALASASLRANRMHHSTLRTLAIAQSLGGRMDDARATVQRILQAQPSLTVSAFMRNSPASPFEHGRRIANALRLAGLPD